MYGKCKAGGIMILLNRSLSYLQRYIFLCETAACCAAKAEKRRKVWCFWIKIERSRLWENPHSPIRIFFARKTIQPFISLLNLLFSKKISLNGLRAKPFTNERFGTGTWQWDYTWALPPTYKTIFISSEQFFPFCLKFFPILKIVFVTKFVTCVQHFWIYVQQFWICVTKFVTKTFRQIVKTSKGLVKNFSGLVKIFCLERFR